MINIFKQYFSWIKHINQIFLINISKYVHYQHKTIKTLIITQNHQLCKHSTLNQDTNHQMSFINTQHIHQCSSCTKSSMHFLHYTYQNYIQWTNVTHIYISQRQFSSIWIKPEKKICKVITNNFWFLIETNNNQTFFLMYEKYPRTCDVHLISMPYLFSWLRWLNITEQYNHKLFIDFQQIFNGSWI